MGAVGAAVSFGMADVGQVTFKTIFSQSAKDMARQAATDFGISSVISFGTWLNGTKMNGIKKGSTEIVPAY